MKAWGRWTGAQREVSLRKTKKAIADGVIPPPQKCNRCGQEKGVIDYHNHNYDHHTDHLEALCIRCHMMLHSEHFAPRQVQAYFDEVKAGKQYPPINNRRAIFYVLERDHGIIKR